MEVYLIRHTSPKVQKGMIYGRTDVKVSESAYELEKANILNELPPTVDKVFSSPSSRCTRLAAEVSETFVSDERLYELNFGDWEGLTWDTINRADSEYWMSDFVNRCPPKGETLQQMQWRVLSFWTELRSQRWNKVALVTHAGVIRILLAHLENIPLPSIFEIEVSFGRVVKVCVGK